ncbi:CoA-binding protein [Alloacidobacterium sp.]|uniref:CoA-binding protein n=1 Tax=Alloacidobacterium sp. TaxID=2951999 RepID=UPI002D6601F3|nr:CoA-binding protein [Alloacidobacterium sp.]HYK34516.1 CoA-binding protein [Alloacidobacterium sp.]
MNEPATIREILDNAKIIAVVGLTDKEGRASLGVSRFMQSRGYRIVPVNPLIESSLGEKAYSTLDATLESVGRIDVVNVFRQPKYVLDIVKDTIRLKIPYLWLQEGVVHEEAAAQAEAAGIKVVMDRCILKERMAAGWG